MALKTEMSDGVWKRLRAATCSDQRTQLLLSLNEEKKSVGDLRDALHVDGPTIIHALRMLQTLHFVSEDGERVYYLTAIGKNMVRKLIDLIGDTEVIVEHEKFWIEHDLSGIPDQLFDRIGALRNSTLVADSKRDPLTTYRSFIAFLENSPTVELITSVYAPDPRFLYEEFVLGHKHIELVVTESVLHHVMEELGQVRVKEALRTGDKLYLLRHDPRLVFAVADHVVILMLSRLGGGFDYSAALTNESSEAIAWGHDLFRHYVGLSESVA